MGCWVGPGGRRVGVFVAGNQMMVGVGVLVSVADSVGVDSAGVGESGPQAERRRTRQRRNGPTPNPFLKEGVRPTPGPFLKERGLKELANQDIHNL